MIRATSKAHRGADQQTKKDSGYSFEIVWAMFFDRLICSAIDVDVGFTCPDRLVE
jgi:hypothetical protein